MLPVTLPLIFSMIISAFVMNNPFSKLAVWFSIIPFTSPVVIILRIPFGVQALQVLLSMGLMIAGFFFTTWLAARIYRTGILLYGKKVSWGEIIKWLKYKE